MVYVFASQKSQLWKILESLGIENIGILKFLWPFGIFYNNLVYFVIVWYILIRFGMLYHEKSGNPD
jgi:hypothetical protein